MNRTFPGFKTLFIFLALTAAMAGCERRAADQSGAESSTGTMSSGAQSSGASQSSSATGADSSAHRAGMAIDDSVITTKAKSALLADTTVKGSQINVETDKGVVSLSGMVDNERQRERAVSIVKGIDGVKSVDNRMTLKQ